MGEEASEELLEEEEAGEVSEEEGMVGEREGVTAGGGGVDGFWYREVPTTPGVCPFCGAFVAQDAKTCPVCGSDIAGKVVVAGKDAGEMERGGEEEKEISVEDTLEKFRKADSTGKREPPHGAGEKTFSLCPTCGALVSDTDTVCPVCNSSLVTSRPAPVASPATREKKRVASDFLRRWERLTSQKEMATLTPSESATEKEIEEGIAYYDHLLELDPTLVHAWENKARFLEKAGRLEEALECYAKAASLVPWNPEAYKEDISRILSKRLEEAGIRPEKEIGGIAGERGDAEAIQKTLDAYDRLLAEKPNLGRVWQLKGELLEKLGRYEEALECYNKAIETNDTKGEAQNLKNQLLSRIALETRPEKEGAMVSPGTGPGVLSGREEEKRGLSLSTMPVRRGKVNGRTNGRINGQINGLINGTSLLAGGNRVNGKGGLINGFLEKRGSRGAINGNGLINGLGLVNGRGLINGNGLVNGLGRIYYPKRLPADFSWLRGTAAIAVLMILVLVLPVFVTLIYTTPPLGGIQIDGEFDEWNAYPEYSDTTGDAADSSVDMVSCRVAMDGSYLGFFVQTHGEIFNSPSGEEDYLLIFIDGDGNSSTGYLYRGLGADNLIMIMGKYGHVDRSALFYFNQSLGQNAWSGFRFGANIKTAIGLRELETKVDIEKTERVMERYDQTRAEVFALMTTESGIKDLFDAPISRDKKMLVVHTWTTAPNIIEKGSTDLPVVKINISTRNMPVDLGGVQVQMFTPPGAVTALRAYIDSDMDGQFSMGDLIEGESSTVSSQTQSERAAGEVTPWTKENRNPFVFGDRVYIPLDAGGTWNESSNTVTSGNLSSPENMATATISFYSPIHIEEWTNITLFITADISPTAPKGEALGFYLPQDGILAENTTSAVYTHSAWNSYIETAPTTIKIDGAFDDWQNVFPIVDRDNDVRNSTSDVINENVDLNKIRLAMDNNNLSFYIQVDGTILGGKNYILPSPPAPVSTTSHPPVVARPKDRDHDGIPDEEDPMPDDFDNDGIPDSMDSDKDNDGTTDYDWGGNDTLLIQQETGARYYIGPIPEPTIRYVSGEDAILIYIDADTNRRTGYRPDGMDLGAEYVALIRGRDGSVTGANLSAYDPTNGTWRFLSNISVGKDMSRIETQVPARLIPPGSFAIVGVEIRGWNNTRDMTDSRIETPIQNKRFYPDRTKAADPVETVTKTLYLNSGDELSTSLGDATTTTRIRNNRDNQWDQTPSFALDFNITGTPTLSIYIEPTRATGINNEGWPDVTFTLGYDATTLGTVTLAEVDTAGWYTITFPTANGTTIPTGASMFLGIEVTGARRGILGRDGYIDVFYDSATYPSRIEMATNTYVHVDSVVLYNATAQTDVFNPGDTVNIVANISDPFGSYDIEGANYTVYYPNGTVLVQGQMTQTASNSSTATYNASFTIPDTAPSGIYTVEVMGIESNGVTHNYSTEFFIPSLYGVAVYPEQTKTGSPGSTVSYTINVRNIGVLSDTYEITLTASSAGWRTDLYDSTGTTLIASDYDGDGTWDYVNGTYDSNGDGNPDVSLSSLSNETYTVVKTVPSDADPGTSDTTGVVATSITNTSITDTCNLTTTTPLSWPDKTLYLRSDDTLQTTPGDTRTQLTINNSDSHTWTQDPPFAKDFALNSTVMISLYIEPHRATGWLNQRWPDITVTLSSDGTTLGSFTYDEVSTAGWYTFPITDVEGTLIPAGSSLSIQVDVTDADSGIAGNAGYAVIYYGDTAYPSNLTVSTTTHVHVDNITLSNATSETYTFSSGETVNVEANVSDPFGSYDIRDVTMTVYYPNGTPLLTNVLMDVKATDPSTLSAWKLFNASFTLPSDAPTGEYTVEIRANESDDTYHYSKTHFFIPCNVTIEPNNTAIAYPGDTVLYTHYINNTGRGADLYNIFSTSTQGWNVTIYDDGTLMAYDSDGDGVWDYVNPAYDTDDDGNPDTGLILPGQTFALTVEIHVPANATPGITDVTTITVVNWLGKCSDSATDTTHVIPEFSSTAVPVLGALAIYWAVREMGKRGNGKKRWQQNGKQAGKEDVQKEKGGDKR